MRNARMWGVVGDRVAVDLMDYNDEQISLFTREVLDTPMIIFRPIRSNILELSEPLRTNPHLENNVSMKLSDINDININDINKEQNYLIVTIFNDSAYELMTGISFLVEVFDGEFWWLVPGYYLFTAEGIPVEPAGSKDFEKDLEFQVGSLTPGLYRIKEGNA